MSNRPRRAKRARDKDENLARQRARARKAPGQCTAWEPTEWQARTREAFRQRDVLVLCGPPGTAKTACAVWLAVEQFVSGRVNKLYLVRPAVEAGERLGFLPGDLNSKLQPYALPVFEFLRALGLSAEEMIKHGDLEVVPLGLCKGRTLHSGVVILDEAQDCTRKQLRLVFGRLGCNSKLIVTGDPEQSDCSPEPDGTANAFQTFCAKLAVGNYPWCEYVRLGPADILRHENVPDLLGLCRE